MKINVTKNYNYQALKDDACKKVDAAAELEREKYTTTGATLNSIYQCKIDEALKFEKLSEEDKANVKQKDFPFLFAEMSSAGGSPQASADVIIAAHTVWKTHMARIEHVRRNTKVAIQLALNDKTTIDNLLKNLNFNVTVTYD